MLWREEKRVVEDLVVVVAVGATTPKAEVPVAARAASVEAR